MPAADQPRRPRSPRFAAAAGLLAGLVALSAAQDAAPKKPDTGAFRLPDGTVVFFTKNPDDPNPKIDGVLLSPKEYQALLEQAELFRKAKEAAKPTPPSECHVRGRVETRDRSFAVLRLTYAFRTTAPRTVVALGGQRAFPAAAAGGDGKLPLLAAGDDGLTVLVERPGDHTLTLDVEVPVGPRGGKGEVGFELGLPRAAITTLALDPPGPDVKTLTVATRTADAPKGAETKRATEDVGRYAPKPGVNGPPLGPAESLEVTWEAPAAAAPAAAETPTAVEADVAVRVEDAHVETTAKLRLRGPAREWAFTLPPGSTVTAAADRPGPTDRTPTVVRPADPAATGWAVRTPDPGEWVVTVTARRTRPDPNHPGPYPVGPFFAHDVPRQSGVVRVFAPVTVRPYCATPPEVRPKDPPGGGGEDAPALVYRYATPPVRDGKPLPLLDLEARPARGAVIVQPAHKLRLTEAGWRLRTDVKVTPVRREVEEIVVELPAGWQAPDVLPPELVEEVRAEPNQRFTVRLAGPRTTPFDLVLEATWPVAPAAREAAVPLPRFPQAVERGAQVGVGVPDGFEIRASARGGGEFPVDLKPPTPPAGAAVTAVAGTFDAAVTRVELGWQPYRPELAADVRADITPHERQVEIVQTITLSAAGGLPRTVRLNGPPAAYGFQDRPALESGGPGTWTFTPAADKREQVLTLRYAVPLPADARATVPLVWPDATRVTATARVWPGGGRRVARFTGPWRELPPAPDDDRDALPVLTLTGTGAGLPLTLELADADDAAAPVVIDRVAVQTRPAEDGTTKVRCRYVLRRWPAAGVDIELPTATQVDVYVDGKQVLPATVADAGGARVVRVPRPDAKSVLPTAMLEVYYTPPPARTGWELIVTPPTVRGAVVRSPVRWLVVVPAAAVPLVPDGAFAADVRWQWRGWGFAPAAAATPADLDAWLAGGVEPDDADEAVGWAPAGGEVVTGRQVGTVRLRVVRVPRAGWVIGCSVVVFVAGLVASRLRPGVLGLAIAVLGAAAAVAAVLVPQPAGQAAAAAQPGVLALVVVLAAQAARRWVHRRRVTHLPTFARGSTVDRPAGSGVGVPARSSRNGPTDAAAAGSSAPPLTPAGPNGS